VQNLGWGIEQLALSALRNVIGALDLDHTLTSRDTINTQLRAALDQATQQWGVKIMRVELKNIDPPQDIKLTMEKQMTAERSRRAMVTNAEGEKSSAILKAEGQKQAAILASQGQAEAIGTVFKAIHDGNPDPKLLAYQYLQVLPQIAQGDANKVWVIPSELTSALGSISERMLPRSGEGTGTT
jgi:regulator of protease activity HflC (stomatin/prohibitin superfamily)